MPLLISFSFTAELAPCSKDFAVLSPSIISEVRKGIVKDDMMMMYGCQSIFRQWDKC